MTRNMESEVSEHIQVVLDPISVPGIERLCQIVKTLQQS